MAYAAGTLPEAFNLVVADACVALRRLPGPAARASTPSAARCWTTAAAPSGARTASRRRWRGSPATRSHRPPRPARRPARHLARAAARLRRRRPRRRCAGAASAAASSQAILDDLREATVRLLYIPARHGGARPRPPRHGADAGAAGRLPRRQRPLRPRRCRDRRRGRLEHTPVADAGRGLHLPCARPMRRLRFTGADPAHRAALPAAM